MTEVVNVNLSRYAIASSFSHNIDRNLPKDKVAVGCALRLGFGFVKRTNVDGRGWEISTAIVTATNAMVTPRSFERGSAFLPVRRISGDSIPDSCYRADFPIVLVRSHRICGNSPFALV